MIQVFDYVEPFKAGSGTRRKRTLGGYRGQPGVYFIWEVGSNAIVYVGMSRSCVVEALYRHFYPWNDSRGNHYRTVYDIAGGDNWRVAVIPATAETAHEIEKALIVALKPRDNRERYEMLMQAAAAPESSTDEELPKDEDDCPF